MRSFLDLHKQVANPDAPTLQDRNITSNVAGNVPVYGQDPLDLAERSVWVSLENWPRLKYFDGLKTYVIASHGMSGDRGDANVFLTPSDAPVQPIRTALTASRTWTISNDPDFANGDFFEIVQYPAAAAAFTLAVVSAITGATLVTIPVSTKARVRVEYDGAAWYLVGYGTLP